jgi:hypothetical protein
MTPLDVLQKSQASILTGLLDVTRQEFVPLGTLAQLHVFASGTSDGSLTSSPGRFGSEKSFLRTNIPALTLKGGNG